MPGGGAWQHPWASEFDAARQAMMAAALVPLLALLTGCKPSEAFSLLSRGQLGAAMAMALAGVALLLAAQSTRAGPGLVSRQVTGLGRWLARPAALPDGPADTVVMIAYHYPPANEIGAARPHRFARYLRRGGAEVAVVCSNALLRRASDSQVLAEEEALGTTPQRVPNEAASVVAAGLGAALHAAERLLLPYRDRAGWLPHAYAAGRRTITRHSVIVSTHPPVVTHLAAMALKLRTGRPWVADFRDPLWGNPYRTSERATFMDPLVERAVVRRADAVIATTEAESAKLRRRYPSMAAKIHTICNGYDPDDAIAPQPRAPHARLTISHVGTLYGDRTPVPLLRCLHRLIGAALLNSEAVQFRQIGRTADSCLPMDDPALTALAALGCLYRTDRHLPQSEARQEMLDADVLVLLDINNANPGLQIPAKLFDYVRSGRPILALTPAGSPSSHVLECAGVPHVCVDPNVPEDAFDRTVADFLSRRTDCVPPSDDFLNQFNAARQTAALAEVLDALRARASVA